MRKRYHIIMLGIVCLLALMIGTAPAYSQLLLASGTFRVIEINKEKNRIGVAKLNANPTVRQNWVYLKINTKVIKRFEQNGWQKDEPVEADDCCDIVEVGDILHVEGGRNFDGSINAKSILIYPDTDTSWQDAE